MGGIFARDKKRSDFTEKYKGVYLHFDGKIYDEKRFILTICRCGSRIWGKRCACQ
jgi:hypothetical protein